MKLYISKKLYPKLQNTHNNFDYKMQVIRKCICGKHPKLQATVHELDVHNELIKKKVAIVHEKFKNANGSLGYECKCEAWVFTIIIHIKPFKMTCTIQNRYIISHNVEIHFQLDDWIVK
jgi:hypothetical protein